MAPRAEDGDCSNSSFLTGSVDEGETWSSSDKKSTRSHFLDLLSKLRGHGKAANTPPPSQEILSLDLACRPKKIDDQRSGAQFAV